MYYFVDVTFQSSSKQNLNHFKAEASICRALSHKSTHFRGKFNSVFFCCVFALTRIQTSSSTYMSSLCVCCIVEAMLLNYYDNGYQEDLIWRPVTEL